MANPNPDSSRARKAKAEKKRQALEPVLGSMLQAIKTAEALLDSPKEDVRLRAVHAVSQAGVNFARVYEVGELELRLEVVEERLAGEHND